MTSARGGADWVEGQPGPQLIMNGHIAIYRAIITVPEMTCILNIYMLRAFTKNLSPHTAGSLCLSYSLNAIHYTTEVNC